MLIEVKIPCDCGTRYKFDVEPLHGRMPARVHCPGCGVEGTDRANAQIRQSQGAVEVLTLEPVPAGRGAEARAVRTRSAGWPLRGTGIARGAMGAITAGLVAMLAWFALIKLTGHQIGFAAWGVGLLVGMGARGFSHAGSRALGWLAGGCAGLALVGGQMLATQAHSGSVANVFADQRVGWLTLLWLFLAVASAFKLASSEAA